MAVTTIRPMLGNPAHPAVPYESLIASGARFQEFIEPRMDADFCFDVPADAAFRSRISPFGINLTDKSFTLQDNAAGKYLQINAGGLNGLLTPTLDQREMTYAGLWNYRASEPETALQVLAGSATGSSAEGGEFLYINAEPSGGLRVNVRGYASQLQVTRAALLDQGFPPSSISTFVFISVTSQLTGSGDGTQHTMFIGAPQPLMDIRTGVKTLPPTPRMLAIGNAYHTLNENYDAMPIRVGRFLSGAGHRTISELNDMYVRAKVVGARRGLAVF